MRGALAGETTEQHIQRLESELEDALDRLERSEALGETEAARMEKHRRGYETDRRDRDFLRDQLTDLQQQIASPSAPRTRGQMARLLAGLLRGEDWRNGTWR